MNKNMKCPDEYLFYPPKYSKISLIFSIKDDFRPKLIRFDSSIIRRHGSYLAFDDCLHICIITDCITVVVFQVFCSVIDVLARFKKFQNVLYEIAIVKAGNMYL